MTINIVLQMILLEIKMKNTTRNTLLITVATAAFMAGPGLVSAQDIKGNREAPAPAAADQKAPVGKTDQHPASLPQKSSPPPTAQAPMKEKTAPTRASPHGPHEGKAGTNRTSA